MPRPKQAFNNTVCHTSFDSMPHGTQMTTSHRSHASRRLLTLRLTPRCAAAAAASLGCAGSALLALMLLALLLHASCWYEPPSGTVKLSGASPAGSTHHNVDMSTTHFPSQSRAHGMQLADCAQSCNSTEKHCALFATPTATCNQPSLTQQLGRSALVHRVVLLAWDEDVVDLSSCDRPASHHAQQPCTQHTTTAHLASLSPVLSPCPNRCMESAIPVGYVGRLLACNQMQSICEHIRGKSGTIMMLHTCTADLQLQRRYGRCDPVMVIACE